MKLRNELSRPPFGLCFAWLIVMALGAIFADTLGTRAAYVALLIVAATLVGSILEREKDAERKP